MKWITSAAYKFYRGAAILCLLLLVVQAGVSVAQAPLPCACNTSKRFNLTINPCSDSVVKCPYYLRNLRAEPMDGNLSELYTPYYVRTGISRYASWNNY